MKRTLTRTITITTVIYTEPRRLQIYGLRTPFGRGYGTDFPEELAEHGCLDASDKIPAGCCKKHIPYNDPTEEWVYDEITWR